MKRNNKLEDIIKKSQKELKKYLIPELTGLGYKPVAKDGFIYAEGSLPVMLVAHLDTVYEHPVVTINYSQDDNGDTIINSPEGIGGDDRAGVYMILEIVKQHKCYVLFCEDEEKENALNREDKGASKFVDSGIKPDANYLVELDRKKSNDAVFYDCKNPDFIKFVCGFGFEKKNGSFSDISVIAPALNLAAVNISAGFYDAHATENPIDEYIKLVDIERNIKRVGKMISTKTERFEY